MSDSTKAGLRDQQLDEIRRRVRMIDSELTRLAMATEPALRWVPAETLRMHLDMAAEEIRAYVAALEGSPAQPAGLARLEASNAMLRDALAPFLAAEWRYRPHAEPATEADADDGPISAVEGLLISHIRRARTYARASGIPVEVGGGDGR